MLQDDGFSLLETLVAVAISAMAFAVLFPVFSDSHVRISNIEKKQSAYAVAVNALNLAVLQIEKGGAPQDSQNENWKWSVSSMILGKNSDPQNNNGHPYQVSIILSKVHEIEPELSISRIIWIYPS